MSRRLFDVARSITSFERSEICCAACGCGLAGSSGRRVTGCRAATSTEMNEQTPDPAMRVRQGMDYGENEEVQEVHAAIQREKREPRVGLEPLSIWLIVLYGFAIFFGGAYLGRYSGDFPEASLDYFNPPKVAKPGGAPGGGEQAAELT